jgi:hypothetical protein
MIILTSNRSYVFTVKRDFFSSINLYKQTWLNNVLHLGATSHEYLSALTVNSLLSEVESILEKKLINTTGHKIKFQFSDAQGIVLYQALLALPLSSNNMYYHLIRNQWIEILDKQLQQKRLYQFT